MIFFILFFVFQSQAKVDSSFKDRIRTCLPHVQRNLRQNLNILINEGVLEVSDDGQITKLPTEFLDSSSRFKHYPIIFFDQIKWCPAMEVFDLVVSHLSKIGFDPGKMDQYLKKRLYQGEVSDLPVLKYQIGESWDRMYLRDLLEQNPNPSPIIMGTLKSNPIFISERRAKSYTLAQQYYTLEELQELQLSEKQALHSTNRAGSVYFGSFNGYGVFSLPYHALFDRESDKIVSCNHFKFSSPAVRKKKIPGFKQILSLPHQDIVFCLVDIKDTGHNLVAAKINWDQDFREQVEFITLGVGSYYDESPYKVPGITVDFSYECRSLVPLTETQYYRPFKHLPGNLRLAMGCDVSHGNSGDGVFEKQTGRYVGMVSSTSQYTFPHLASKAMNASLEKQRLYNETSHIIPIPLIKEAMEKLLKSDEIPSEQKDFIHWILQQD